MTRPSVGLSKEETGFTLIELLVSFVIIAILVSMVIMLWLFSTRPVYSDACKGNVKILNQAVVQYSLDHKGDYPESLDELKDGNYIRKNFKWTCPAGEYDYRDYYDPESGMTYCPNPDHQ